MENTDRQLMDFRQVLIAQKDIAKPIFERYGTEEAAIKKSMGNIEELFSNRLSSFQPEIMFYGIYNAGKSSLLNALMGEERAKVGDVPTTDTIDFYDWNGYRLADTPGVNAPIKHQQVTEEHLRKSDVVIFIMSTNGGFEDAYNYSQMAKIIQSGKQLIIVLNDKVGYVAGKPADDKTLHEIKQKIAQNMLQMGVSSNIHQIQSQYQVILVHAKRALRGRLQADSNGKTLIDNSNIVELEKAIQREIVRADGYKILITVVDYFETELKKVQDYIESKYQESNSKELSTLLATVREQKNVLQNSMAASISAISGGLESKLTQGMWDNRSNEALMKEAVNNIIVDCVKKVQSKLMTELTQSQEVLRVKLSETVKSLTEVQERIKQSVKMPEINSINYQDDKIVETASGEGPEKEIDAIKKTLALLQKFMPRPIIEENPFPKKNPLPVPPISPATEQILNVAMELAKKAGYAQLAKTIAVAIPYIGPIIFVASVLISLIPGNNDEDDFDRKCKKAEIANEQEKRRVEIELQARQELRQNCRAMVYDLSEAMTQTVREQIAQVFQAQETLLEESLEQSNTKVASLSIDIKLINTVMDDCRALRTRVSR